MGGCVGLLTFGRASARASALAMLRSRRPTQRSSCPPWSSTPTTTPSTAVRAAPRITVGSCQLGGLERAPPETTPARARALDTGSNGTASKGIAPVPGRGALAWLPTAPGVAPDAPAAVAALVVVAEASGAEFRRPALITLMRRRVTATWCVPIGGPSARMARPLTFSSASLARSSALSPCQRTCGSAPARSNSLTTSECPAHEASIRALIPGPRRPAYVDCWRAAGEAATSGATSSACPRHAARCSAFIPTIAPECAIAVTRAIAVTLALALRSTWVASACPLASASRSAVAPSRGERASACAPAPSRRLSAGSRLCALASWSAERAGAPRSTLVARFPISSWSFDGTAAASPRAIGGTPRSASTTSRANLAARLTRTRRSSDASRA